jgi:hypothetical protein
MGAPPGQSGGRRASIVHLREDVMLMETQTQQVDTKLASLNSLIWNVNVRLEREAPKVA